MRPTKYNEEILEKARDYIDNFYPDGVTEILPTIAGLATRLGVRRNTIYDWMSHEDKEEFSNIAERIMTMQEQMLVTGGLTNKFSSVITKLMLTKHGYTDKTETKDTTKKSVEDLSDEELDEFIAARAKQI